MNLTTRIALLVSTVGGIGYFPVASGTVGSLAGVALYYLIGPDPIRLLAVIGVLFLIGAWSGSVAERHFGSTDPSAVVLDEVMGMLITYVFNPVGWIGAIVGFLLFRVADIIKPFPANRLEALHGGTGVMADDAMAAVYANLALRLFLWLVPAAALGSRL